MRFCQACEEGRHYDCGMQTWCECDCDPEGFDFNPTSPRICAAMINAGMTEDWPRPKEEG